MRYGGDPGIGDPGGDPGVGGVVGEVDPAGPGGVGGVAGEVDPAGPGGVDGEVDPAGPGVGASRPESSPAASSWWSSKLRLRLPLEDSDNS